MLLTALSLLSDLSHASEEGGGDEADGQDVVAGSVFKHGGANKGSVATVGQLETNCACGEFG